MLQKMKPNKTHWYKDQEKSRLRIVTSKISEKNGDVRDIMDLKVRRIRFMIFFYVEDSDNRENNHQSP